MIVNTYMLIGMTQTLFFKYRNYFMKNVDSKEENMLCNPIYILRYEKYYYFSVIFLCA